MTKSLKKRGCRVTDSHVEKQGEQRYTSVVRRLKFSSNCQLILSSFVLLHSKTTACDELKLFVRDSATASSWVYLCSLVDDYGSFLLSTGPWFLWPPPVKIRHLDLLRYWRGRGVNCWPTAMWQACRFGLIWWDPHPELVDRIRSFKRCIKCE